MGGARSSGAGHLSEALYGAGFSLLFAHDVDSGYWKEWELFHLPGGIQLFVLVHIAMGALLLAGFRRVVLGERAARAWALLLAAGGMFGFGIHMTLIALGNEEFRRPASVGVLAALLAVSVALAAVTLRGRAAEQQATDNRQQTAQGRRSLSDVRAIAAPRPDLTPGPFPTREGEIEPGFEAICRAGGVSLGAGAAGAIGRQLSALFERAPLETGAASERLGRVFRVRGVVL